MTFFSVEYTDTSLLDKVVVPLVSIWIRLHKSQLLQIEMGWGPNSIKLQSHFNIASRKVSHFAKPCFFILIFLVKDVIIKILGVYLNSWAPNFIINNLLQRTKITFVLLVGTFLNFFLETSCTFTGLL